MVTKLPAIVTIWLSLFSMLPAQSKVLCGIDRLAEYRHLFTGKRIALVTNHTALNHNGRHLTDLFSEMNDVKIQALFGPEHGIRGKAGAGEKIDSAQDPLHGVPVYSLYGKVRKPTAGMLKNVDVLVFDIQDVGSRFYTYIWTMALAMEAAAEQHIPFIVLDRPNPLNGLQIEGNLLDSTYASFVGLYPIPVRHGMTVGELAQMFNREGWLKNGIQAELTVIPLKNWTRNQWFDQTGLKFIKPSPNMPDLATATVYPGMCLLEGTNVSEGRGTNTPFQIFGAPWIDDKVLSAALNNLKLPGLRFEPVTFTPRPLPGVAANPKYKDQVCRGCKIEVVNRARFQPYRSAIHILEQIIRLYPDQIKWRSKHFKRLCGSAAILAMLQSGAQLEPLFATFSEQEARFRVFRKTYLIYP